MLKEYLLSLADAFRSKLGITGKINAQNFPDKVKEVYDKGKDDEWSEFWDSIQTSGSSPANYDYKFRGTAWNDNTFRPKYDIVPSGGGGVETFARSNIKDFEACLKKGGIDGKGVTLDLTRCTNANTMFSGSSVEILPEIDVSKASLYNFCSGCTKLTTVRKIKLGSGKALTSTAFPKCTALANIVIEGTLNGTSSFQDSPLSKESIISVIEALSDASEGQTLTLKKTAVNTAFGIDVDNETTYTDEWRNLRDSKANWTFAYA